MSDWYMVDNFRYALPMPRALSKIREHCNAIVSSLSELYPLSQLHKIPWKDVLLTTGRVLAERSDFKVVTESGYRSLRPVEHGRELYAYHEIGNNLALLRVTSQLRAEGILKKGDEELFKTVVGRIYHLPPVEARQAQVRAFDWLVGRMGNENAEKLIIRAQQVWKAHARYAFMASKRLSPQERERYPLLDMFGNTWPHYIFYYTNFEQLAREGNSPVNVCREKLVELLEMAQGHRDRTPYR